LIKAGSGRAVPRAVGCKAEEESDSGAIADDDNAADVLKEAPCTTGELCARFSELDRTTVLQHLRVLEKAELVTGRRVGRERHLALAPLPIKRIHDRWIGEYARAAVDLLARLDRIDAEQP
jgi:DNA-binding transcriptional ArsR family regulator